ncbi:MAG: transketolase [Muribaculaceae bacterium]|nr:transketolase [Muribaculaceae bacterium]
MRPTFINKLIAEAQTDSRIFLMVGDLGYNMIEPFREKFPKRFLNAGIAEQNMMGVAAGMAMQGFIVYVYSIGNFNTLRCLEQIRNDVCYNNLNVRIVCMGEGYSYGSAGMSHHATEDIGVMRVLPGIVVASPANNIETEKIISLSFIHTGPMYIRLGKTRKLNAENYNPEYLEKVSNMMIGEVLPVINNNKTNAILSTSSLVEDLKDQIETSYNDYDLYSVPFLKPLSKIHLKAIAEKYDSLICLEEHQENCGMSSAIIEIINDMYAKGEIRRYPIIYRRGIKDKFQHLGGSQSYLREKEGLGLPIMLD